MSCMAKKLFCLRFTLMAIAAFMWAASAVAADVAILMSSEIPLFKEAEAGFKSVIRGNVPTYVVDAVNDPDNKILVRKLRRENIDLLLVIGSQAMQIAVKNFKHIPLVFCFVLDYSRILNAESATERIDLSGVTLFVAPDEQIKTLLEINPQVKRLGIVYDRSKSSEMVEQARRAAQRLGISLLAKGISSKEEAINAISAMEGEIDAFLMLPDFTVLTPESVKYLLLSSFKNKISLVGLSEKYVKQGALLSLSFDSKEIGKQAGELAYDRLENMQSKIVDPRTLRLFVNKNTAAQLNITIPDSVMKRAYQIY